MIYIDCGYYAGMALQKWIDKGTVTKDWTIYAFECNPNIEAERELIRKAVWIEDGEMEFQIGGRHDAGHLKDMTSCGFEDIGKVEILLPSSGLKTSIAPCPLLSNLPSI